MTGPQLPAYSGATTCPKCTCEFIRSSYRWSLRPVVEDGEILFEAEQVRDILRGEHGTECMLRTCHDCGWAWLEQTADATSKQPAQVA